MTHHTPPDRFVRDKHNKIALIQAPNLPLIGWALFGLLAFIFGEGTPHRGFQMLSRASLFTWAYLEIRSGHSPARRSLGVLIMLLVIAGFFRNE